MSLYPHAARRTTTKALQVSDVFLATVRWARGGCHVVIVVFGLVLSPFAAISPVFGLRGRWRRFHLAIAVFRELDHDEVLALEALEALLTEFPREEVGKGWPLGDKGGHTGIQHPKRSLRKTGFLLGAYEAGSVKASRRYAVELVVPALHLARRHHGKHRKGSRSTDGFEPRDASAVCVRLSSTCLKSSRASGSGPYPKKPLAERS